MLIYKETQHFYEGDFLENQKHGKGKETYADGSYFHGEFALDQKHGRGKFVFADRSYYEGDFFKDFI